VDNDNTDHQFDRVTSVEAETIEAIIAMIETENEANDQIAQENKTEKIETTEKKDETENVNATDANSKSIEATDLLGKSKREGR
jgi:hypothetical protein